MEEIKKIKEGDYFRSYSGLVGQVLDIVCMIDGRPYIGFKNNNNKYCLLDVGDIEKYSSNIIDLFEYEDVLKVYNKLYNGYMYYGFSENNFSTITDLKNALLADVNITIVGIMTKQKMQKNFFYTVERVCTTKEQETCQREKLGCKGCFYNLTKKEDKI